VLRAFVVALLLANLAFYAWTQGWLDGVVGTRSIGDREPERMTRQVRPETIRILPAGDAGAAAANEAASAPAALACLEAGPFSDAEVAAAQAAAQAVVPAGGWITARTEQPAAWVVYMGRYANLEAMTKKEEELKRRKLTYDEVIDHPTLAPGLTLGRFDDRASANKALDRFADQGIHTARVVELKPATSSQWLRVEKADAAMADRLAAVSAPALGKGFVACAKGPGT